jgi:hypothetical protein
MYVCICIIRICDGSDNNNDNDESNITSKVTSDKYINASSMIIIASFRCSN